MDSLNVTGVNMLWILNVGIRKCNAIKHLKKVMVDLNKTNYISSLMDVCVCMCYWKFLFDIDTTCQLTGNIIKFLFKRQNTYNDKNMKS